jgi:hypothetical protein
MMKGIDKFLAAIVAAVVILIVAALLVARMRPDSPEFLADDTPEHIAYNYLLAIEQKEYSRAYGYLSPSLPGYPTDLDMFVRDVRRDFYAYSDSNEVSRAVTLSKSGDNTTWINVRETHFNQGGGLLPGSQYSINYEMALRQEDGNWLLIESDRYWSHCWDHPNQAGCWR